MEGIIMAAQIILSLSILVGLHEAGHMFAAKYFGMRVEQFSIGFPPKIFGVQYGETEYSIGAIPLGGFVKISGMIDESMDVDAMKEAPKDYEFRSKPAWQRLIVMMGGIIVNVITGIIIFIALEYTYGDQYFSKDDVNQYGIVANELAREVGLKTGDKILAVNGEDYSRLRDVISGNVLLADNPYYTVQRGSETLTIDLPEDLIEKLSDKNSFSRFIEPRYPFTVGEVSPGTEADKIGLETGDKILSIDGVNVEFYDEFETEKLKHLNEDAEMTILHDNEEKQLNFHLDDTGVIGFFAKPGINISYANYSFGESIVKGTDRAFMAVWLNIKGLGKMISGKIDPRKSMMGPIGIARVFGGTWDWQRFWNLTGMLSMILAFMNFLPIPALDGGHVMFLTYEIISGRAPGDKFLEMAQKVGMVLLLALMAFVIGNDIWKLF